MRWEGVSSVSMGSSMRGLDAAGRGCIGCGLPFKPQAPGSNDSSLLAHSSLRPASPGSLSSGQPLSCRSPGPH